MLTVGHVVLQGLQDFGFLPTELFLWSSHTNHVTAETLAPELAGGVVTDNL